MSNECPPDWATAEARRDQDILNQLFGVLEAMNAQKAATPNIDLNRLEYRLRKAIDLVINHLLKTCVVLAGGTPKAVEEFSDRHNVSQRKMRRKRTGHMFFVDPLDEVAEAVQRGWASIGVGQATGSTPQSATRSPIDSTSIHPATSSTNPADPALIDSVLETVGTHLLANIDTLPSPYPPIQRIYNRDSDKDTSDSDCDDDQAKQAVTALERNQPGTIASKEWRNHNYRLRKQWRRTATNVTATGSNTPQFGRMWGAFWGI